jgi:hypothetical protein
VRGRSLESTVCYLRSRQRRAVFPWGVHTCIHRLTVVMLKMLCAYAATDAPGPFLRGPYAYVHAITVQTTCGIGCGLALVSAHPVLQQLLHHSCLAPNNGYFSIDHSTSHISDMPSNVLCDNPLNVNISIVTLIVLGQLLAIP